MPDFSVVICTYNGALRLPQILEKLKAQKEAQDCRSAIGPESYSRKFQWEVLIVDNNSSDHTPQIVQQFQQSWRPGVPLRYCFEPRQGLAFARRKAIAETQSSLIGFLDDDTLPAECWVSEARKFGQTHPNVGAYGSNVSGQYEVPPPEGFERIACCLAIIERGQQPFQYAARGVLPAGAGMVIRRQAWLEQVPAIPALAGVSGKSLKTKGEDVETLSYIRTAWPVWHNPAMRIAHVIPKARLERQYLLNLFWQIGLSRYALRQTRYSQWTWWLILLLYLANDLRKVLRCLFPQLRLPAMKLGTVEACEFSLLLGSLLSPFLHGQSVSNPLSSGSPSSKPPLKLPSFLRLISRCLL